VPGGNKGQRTPCQESQVSGRDSNYVPSKYKSKVNIGGVRHTPRQMLLNLSLYVRGKPIQSSDYNAVPLLLNNLQVM
jgi:hypothetical protein